MFLRAMDYIEKEKGLVPTEKALAIDKAYSDRDSVSPWAVTAVATLNEKGIMKGTTNSTFNPKSTAMVEEAVIMALRSFMLYCKCQE